MKTFSNNVTETQIAVTVIKARCLNNSLEAAYKGIISKDVLLAMANELLGSDWRDWVEDVVDVTDNMQANNTRYILDVDSLAAHLGLDEDDKKAYKFLNSQLNAN